MGGSEEFKGVGKEGSKPTKRAPVILNRLEQMF